MIDAGAGNPRVAPVTARGRRSRGALLAGARAVFARDGFANARITDIAAQAQVAVGTFYMYFTSKDDILLTLLAELEDELRGSRSAAADGLGTYERIAHANREYLDAYWANRELMIVWEQVSTLNPQVAALRNAASDRATERIERSIRAMQVRNIVDPGLEAPLVAFALSGMVSNFAYRYCLRELSFSIDAAADQLTRLWAGALGITAPQTLKAATRRSSAGRVDGVRRR